MKNPVFLLIIMSLFSVSVQAAQQRVDTGPGLDKVFDQLQLNAGQASQLTRLIGKHRQQMESLRVDKKQLREQMHQIREQHRAELLTVLSYQQLYEFEKFMHENRPRNKREKKSQ